MKTTKVNCKDSTCSRCCHEIRESEKGIASLRDSGSRRTNGPTPRWTSYRKIGLVCILFVSLLILSCTTAVECKRLPRKNRSRSSDTVVDPDPTSEEAAREGRHKRKNKRILKTSEKARILTQRKYLVRDWCKSKPLKQFVRSSNGCKGVFINHFCYGQCNSFYIPRDLTPDMTAPAYFKSCAFCKPHREERISVTLTCSRNRGKRNRYIKRMVNKIKECRCIAVPDFESQSSSPAAPPLPSSEATAPDIATMASSASKDSTR